MMIDKWLKAGAVEGGFLRPTIESSPQRGVISPCLSNVFLHHALDEWRETEVKRVSEARTPLSGPPMTR
jgi:RNA-directed DNA polymerase